MAIKLVWIEVGRISCGVAEGFAFFDADDRFQQLKE